MGCVTSLTLPLRQARCEGEPSQGLDLTLSLSKGEVNASLRLLHCAPYTKSRLMRIASDVVAVFPDEDTVNRALREIIIAQAQPVHANRQQPTS